MELNTQHFLEELEANILEKDAIKAQLLMAHWPELDWGTREDVLTQLSVPSAFCTLVLGDLVNIAPLPRIQALLEERVSQFPEVWNELLRSSPSPQLLEMAKAVPTEVAVPALLAVMHATLSDELLVVGIEMLGILAHPSALDTLTDYLYCGKRPLIEAAIKALGKFKNPLVSRRLLERMGTSRDLDLLIMDALAAAQDEEAIRILSDMLISSDVGLRNRAKTLLEKLGSKAVPQLTQNLKLTDVDILIQSLNVLGLIGDSLAAAPIRHLLQEEPTDSNVRFAAYEALGLLPLDKGAFILAEGLSDPVFAVCIAAAKAIERHHNPVMIHGIKNLVHQGEGNARKIVAAFIDSEADTIVESLFEDQTFCELAQAYLAHEAHPDIRQHFKRFLGSQGSDPTQKALLKVFAVDDSRMILNIYKSALYQIGCEAQLFEFPSGALEHLEKDKPDLLITDLNMPEITGIELAQRVRSRYNKEELPILMVTTQSDLSDHASAYEAGVNAILHKPFTKEDLKEAIDRLVTTAVH